MKDRDRAKFEARQKDRREAEKQKRRQLRERGLNAVAFWAYEHDRDDERDISAEVD